MQGVIIIGSGGEEWKCIRTHAVSGCTARYDIGNSRHVLEFPNGYLACNLEPALANEYEKEELEGLPFQSPLFIAVEYSTPDILRHAVREGLFHMEAWIDDDHHPPMPLAQFWERLAVNPSWDWRA